MRNIFITITFWLFFNILGFSQCPEMIFKGKIEYSEFYKNFLKQKPQKDSSLIIYGGYIHQFDTIKVFKCHNQIYESKINNRNVGLDGTSFVVKTSFEKFENRSITVQLDNCYFLINIPSEMKRIRLERVRPHLSVYFY